MSQDKISVDIYTRWIEASIREGSIYCFPESDLLLEPMPTAGGASGVVHQAKVKRFRSFFRKPNSLAGMTVAVKTFVLAENRNEEEFYRKFVQELNNHRNANDHPNIIRFLGLCKGANNTYRMVFELAEGGNLRQHLIKYFKVLTWRDKCKLGLGIVNGLKYLHSLDIIHKDLSSNNILIQLGIAKIADFGLSSVLKQMSPSNGLGTLAYKDPASFNDDNESCEHGKESDIFSLGVILWEISSGKMPCDGHREHATIVMYRLNGSRDNPFPGTPEEYIKLYSECWDEDPNKRPICEDVYERLKRLEYCNALNDFNKMLEVGLDHACTLRNRGAIYHNLDQYNDALEDFNKSLAIEPDNAWTLSRRGAVYLHFKQYDNALCDLNRSLEIEPDNAWTLSRRGAVYLHFKQHDNALRDLNKSLEIEPDDAWTLSMRGSVYQNLERHNDALEDFSKSLAIEPDNAWTLGKRGAIYIHLKECANALHDFNKLLAIESNDAYAWSGRGAVYLGLKQYDEALTDFNKSLAIEPNNAWTLSRRGTVYLNLKQYNEALNDFNESLKLKPNDAWALSRRSRVYVKLKEYDNALDDLNKSLETDPNSAWALSHRGAVYYYLEKYNDALNDFNESLKIEPNNTWTLSLRGAAYLHLELDGDAFNDLNRSLDIEPDNIIISRIKGTVLPDNVKTSRDIHDTFELVDIN